MKNFSQIQLLFLTLLLLLIPSCSKNNSTSTQNVEVKLSVDNVVLLLEEQMEITATVTGTNNTEITWEVTGGQIKGNGSTVTYTAPSDLGEYTIKVISKADSQRSASATIHVTEEHSNFILYETTKVINKESAAILTSVAPDASLLTFTGSTTFLENLKEGDVLVIGANSVSTLPDGILLKVDKVKKTQGGYQISTSLASFADAIKEGNFKYHGRFSVEGKGLEDATLTPQLDFNGCPIKKTPQREKSFEGVTVKVGAKISSCMDLELDMSFEDGLKKLDLKVTFVESVDGSIKATGKAEKKWKEILFERNLPPIRFLIGAVPVFLTPHLEIYGELTITAEATGTAQFTISANQVVGISYDGENWKSTAEKSKITPDGNIEVKGTLSAKPCVGSTIDISAYGFNNLLAAYLDIKGCANASATISISQDGLKCSAELSASLEGEVGVSSDVFGKSKGIPLTIAEKKIGEFEKDPCAIFTLTPETASLSARVNQSTNTNFTLSGKGLEIEPDGVLYTTSITGGFFTITDSGSGLLTKDNPSTQIAVEASCPSSEGSHKGKLSVLIAGETLTSEITLQCTDDDDPPPPPPPPSPPKCKGGCPGGQSNGDPHIVTFDRLGYDFQAAGEFILVEASQEDITMQIRQEPVNGSDTVSTNTAVAVNINGDRVGIYARQNNELMVNSNPTTITTSPLELPNGGKIFKDSNLYVVVWPDTSHLWVKVRGNLLNVRVAVTPERKNTLSGILGNIVLQRNVESEVKGNVEKVRR